MKGKLSEKQAKRDSFKRSLKLIHAQIRRQKKAISELDTKDDAKELKKKEKSIKALQNKKEEKE